MRKQVLGVALTVVCLTTGQLSARAETPAESPKSMGNPKPDVSAKLDLSKFTLVWQDEFDGDQLDTTKWQAPEMPRQGSSRWVKSLVSVGGGNLRLGIRLSDDPILRYDCGAVRTQRDYDAKQTMFSQTYGYYETRCKMPKHVDADYFADFWMMCGKVGDKTPDTRDGLEVDIFESFHLAHAKAMKMSFHWNGYGARHNVWGFTGKETPQILDGDYHTYGMYWDEKVYVLFIDGEEIGRTDFIGMGSAENGKTMSQGPCQKPGYLKLTVEAAAWAGASNAWETNPPVEDEFVIDYVRVYTGTLPESAKAPAKESANQK